MPITIGLDLGTTSISAVAVDALAGDVIASTSLPNTADTTSPEDRARGRSEWDIRRMAAIGCAAIRACIEALGTRRAEVAGLGLTGQQHGVVIVDDDLAPLSAFINWQDQRGEEAAPGCDQTFTQRAVELAGPDATQRAGCTLATGFMGTTLFWMQATGVVPPQGTACFAADFVASWLTGRPPITDPTHGASSGLLDLHTRTWDAATIAALGLPRALFPAVGEAGDLLGGLRPAAADATGLPEGLPVFIALGDNQASFLGSAGCRADAVLVNVGTGAQVARRADRVCESPALETRPFPRGGYLLVHASLSGGKSYAVLDGFFRRVARDVLGADDPGTLYDRMNALALTVPRDADGLRCAPDFAGSRSDPDQRASFTGVSDRNFTPAHLVRAVLEGLARSFYEGYNSIRAATGSDCTRLVGAGNGLRENAALAGIVAEEFGLPLALPAHREEAAYGAALVAAFGADIWPSLPDAAEIIEYEAARRV